MSLPESPSILSFEDARHVVEEHAAGIAPISKESVDLLQSVGRVLAEPLVADRDFPPFPRATRDGYALLSADLRQMPAWMKVIGEIKAGASPDQLPAKLNPGEAVAIMTGAPVPLGADAVVMVEYTSRTGNRVEITKDVCSGENIVPTGAEAHRGDILLKPGVRLDAAAIAIAASVGKGRVEVYRQTRVAILATGDELVDVGRRPGDNEIRNSNSYSLAAQVQSAGGRPELLPIAPDEPKRLRALIEKGLQADLLLLTGGVSMGKYDLVEQILAELKAEFFFTGAQIQPGRPVVFGRYRARESSDGRRRKPARHKSDRPTYLFGLPGNPVSTMVTFELFARPLLEALAGTTPRPLVFLHAKLKSEIKTKTGLKRFLPGIVSGEFERTEVELIRWQGSGDLAATGRANCYVVVPPDRDRIPAGEWVAVLPR
ncbi:MAG TPA: gephyrin-like molybdotransferase Glp [Terriglobales bacterium]|nr:gephyrin-like molybdotransferase Glp [Terriglobales bacterium]